MRKNNLDEMQEQRLLRIESRGCWLAFWGMFLSMGAQMLLYGNDFEPRMLAGEWIVFMVLAIYLVAACIRAGIWDRHLRPTTRDNVLASVVAGGAFGVFTAFQSYRNYGRPVGSVAAGVVAGVTVFVITFSALAMMSRVYRKKRETLEREPEE